MEYTKKFLRKIISRGWLSDEGNNENRSRRKSRYFFNNINNLSIILN